MPGIISQQAAGKVINYGIEANRELTWSGWEPGKEYTKNIVLKNIRVKTQKLKYKVPKSRYFTTLYPQPIMLSAGNIFSLPITFRPIEKVVYEDTVQFVTNDGNFVIPIKAVLPEFNVSLPDVLTLGVCAVSAVIQATFDISNDSELVTPFHFDVLEPFRITPTDGVLHPFSTATIIASFQPKEATIYECHVIVKYGLDLSHKTCIKLIASGKYAYLAVTSPVSSPTQREVLLNFGAVPIGQTVNKFIEVTSLSPVNAPFTVEHQLVLPTEVSAPLAPPPPQQQQQQQQQQPCVDSNVIEQHALDEVFICKLKKGIVSAHKTLRIPITFVSRVAGANYVDYFHVRTDGCPTRTTVKCIASCLGPSVELSQGLMSFHLVMFGETLTKALDVTNHSDTDAVFQFDIDNQQSIFTIDPCFGTVTAHSHKTILVHFCPQQPINYYRRIACLVHNQGVINLDLLGTCHREMETPAVLQPIHIQRYELYVDRGLSLTAPEVLNAMLAESKLAIDGLGALYPAHLCGLVPTDRVDDIDAVEEYFNDGHHSDLILTSPHVSLDVTHVNFDGIANINNSTHETVSLTNHTTGKVCVIWSVTGNEGVFTVSPVSAEVPPLTSISFQVTFRPRAVNQLFSAQLECYAQYKTLRDYCLTDDKTHMPPWCLTLRTIGNTFQPNSEVFLPRFSVDPQQMSLSVVNKNDAIYKTILFLNTGPTPILYSIDKDTTGIFAIKPSCGLVSPGSQQVFVIKFSANDEGKVHKHQFIMNLNGCDKYKQVLTVYGSVEAAAVRLDNDGVMYFKQTCVNTVSSRQFAVQNVSRLPVNFEWRIKHSDSLLLNVHPMSGLILPSEIQYHDWFFKPSNDDKYVMKPVLVTWTSRQPGYRQTDGKLRYSTLRAIGEGSSGQIKCEQSSIEVGPVVVGTVTYRHLTLANDSSCTLYYKLSVEQTTTGPYSDNEQFYTDNIGLDLSQTQGTLAARSRCDVLLTIRPLKRVSYHWQIAYCLQTSEGDRSTPESSASQHLCHVTAVGVYPAIAVTDAHCYGSAIGISKKQLWTLFSLDNFNMFLDGDPSDEELTYSSPIKHSHQRRPPVYTRAVVDFNFSAAPVGSEPCVVQLQLENTSPVACDWKFLFPSDQQLELEYWAESGEFDITELHELKVMDNKLFTVEPMKGRLLAGSNCVVTLTYKHSLVGTDRLPVLLKLTRGREILLNFVGVTVEVDRHYIHFASNRHMFTPVAIGELRSPVQVYEMYNGGAVPVNYSFDLSPLTTVFQDNYSHKVFECLNPCGTIAPGQTAGIEWKFSPLEARTYMVDITINIENNESAIVTFTGIGYDKRLMGSTMSNNNISPSTGVPSVQSHLLPGQVCCLSSDRLSLGNVPLLTSVRRVVVITNTSSQHCMKYTWHVTNEFHAQFLTVYPRSDTLLASQSALCTIKFYAVHQPSFYDIDLICETVDLAEYSNYEKKLARWETERERQIVEFTITDKDLDADMRLPSPEDRPSSARLQSLCHSSSPELELSKYKTLPPITNASLSLADIRSKQKQQRKYDECFWPQPQPPKPFLLHLGLTARTHDIAEFHLNFPDQYQRFFIDRSLSESVNLQNIKTDVSNISDENSTMSTIYCQQNEADMLAITLSNILRSLIDDNQFHEACVKVSSEQVPYFKQFTTTNITPVGDDHQMTCLSPAPSPPVQLSLQNASSQPVSSLHQSPGHELPSSSPYSSAGKMHTEPMTESHQSIHTQLSDDNSASISHHTSTLASVRSAVISPSPISNTNSVPSFHDQSELKLTPSQELRLKQAETQMEENNFTAKQHIKKLPEFGNLAETCLENTLMNIIQEAFKQEFNITARPRLEALQVASMLPVVLPVGAISPVATDHQ